MKKIAAMLWFVLASPVVAQTGTVTGTVTDTDGQVWSNGTVAASLGLPSGAFGASPTIGGNPVPALVKGRIDANGAFSLALTRTDALDQAGGQWTITACPNASVSKQFPTGCYGITTPLTGSTLVLTSQFSAAPAPRFPAGAGAYGYSDGEVITPSIPGMSYFNTSVGSLAGLRLWDGYRWVANASSGGGSVTPPGISQQVPYNGGDSTFHATNWATDGHNIMGLNNLDYKTTTSSSGAYFPAGAVSPSFTQNQSIAFVHGSGVNIGNAGVLSTGWSGGKFRNEEFNIYVRGIKQFRSGILRSYGVGDSAMLYDYLFGHFGIHAQSDEGFVLHQGEMQQIGTVYAQVNDVPGNPSTITVGSTSIAVPTFNIGNDNFFDGGTVIDYDVTPITGDLNGAGAQLSDSAYLYSLPITGTVPASRSRCDSVPFYVTSYSMATNPDNTGTITINGSGPLAFPAGEHVTITGLSGDAGAILNSKVVTVTAGSTTGTFTATTTFYVPNMTTTVDHGADGLGSTGYAVNLAATGNTADAPVSTTLVCRLMPLNGGASAPLTVGVADGAGTNYPEQTVITAAGTPYASTIAGVTGTVTLQQVTFTRRNPQNYGYLLDHNKGFIGPGAISLWQGGVAGRFMSMDSQVALSQGAVTTTYKIVGSEDGHSLVYAVNKGGMVNVGFEVPGIDSAVNSGTGTAGQTSAFTLYAGAELVNPYTYGLEYNPWPWSRAHHIAEPNFMYLGGHGIWYTATFDTPASNVQGGEIDLQGGINGNVTGMRVRNNPNAWNTYTMDGGWSSAPSAYEAIGTWDKGLTIDKIGSSVITINNWGAALGHGSVNLFAVPGFGLSLTPNPATDPTHTDASPQLHFGAANLDTIHAITASYINASTVVTDNLILNNDIAAHNVTATGVFAAGAGISTFDQIQAVHVRSYADMFANEFKWGVGLVAGLVPCYGNAGATQMVGDSPTNEVGAVIPSGGGTHQVLAVCNQSYQWVVGAPDALPSAHTPASSAEACFAGQRAYDASYEYVCVADNTWKRTSVNTW